MVGNFKVRRKMKNLNDDYTEREKAIKQTNCETLYFNGVIPIAYCQ